MSEKKTIQINPDLFKMSNKNTTRKKREPTSPKLQLKSELKTQKQKTLRKNVLKLIREKQQEAYKDLFDKKKPKIAASASASASSKTEFDKDFDSSLQFFSSLANKVEQEAPKSQNITFKNYDAINSISPVISPALPTLSPITMTPLSINTNTVPIQRGTIHIPATPKFGCLKGGTLPTYRTYTRKNGDFIGGAPPKATINQPFMTPSVSSLEKPAIFTNTFDSQASTPMSFLSGGSSQASHNKFIEQSQKFDKIQQGSLSQKEKASQKIKYKKRKKIFKKTYKVGRSKTEPTIGVLVSNKTIRSRISTQAQLLKQTPINEVRKFLIKKGFIKVGTDAPNDVLRKMYETVSMVCGEIQNHNPENLLYNFIHDQE
jgi:hypothetical protein